MKLFGKVRMLTLIGILLLALAPTHVGAVVFCNMDEVDSEDAQQLSARAAEAVYLALAESVRMLAFGEAALFKKGAVDFAIQSHKSALKHLEEAKNLFQKLIGNTEAVKAGDSVLLGASPAELGARLKRAMVSPKAAPWSKLLPRISKEGARVVLQGCSAEVETVLESTRTFRDQIKFDRGNPVGVWTYTRVWNRAVFIGRGSSALFLK